MEQRLRREIENQIKRALVCWLSYIDAEGFPVAKAMLAPREREGIRTFWFSTNTSSNKVHCFRADNRASVYFCDRLRFRGVSLAGRVEVLETPQIKKRLWRAGDRMYYPLGVDDPDYCALQFTAERGRYYRGSDSEDFSI